MKIIKTLATVAALIVTVFAIGYLIMGYTLPDETVVKSEFDVAAAPEKVWQVLNDHEKYPEWAPNIAKVEVINDKQWREWPGDSDLPLAFTVVNEQAPGKLELGYTMGPFFEGHWKGEITATPTGSHVTTEDRMQAKTWATKITMYPFFDLNDFVKTWNRKLKERAETLK